MEKFIQKNYKKIAIVICVLGILFRTIYIVENPIRKNQYDCKIWSLYDLNDYEQVYEMNEDNIGKAGHMYYIFTIYNTWSLPDSAGGQYYHPPLHHFISAVWLKVMDIFPLNAMQKIESLQVLSLIYSIIMLLFCYKIIEKTKIKEMGKIVSLILINFFPIFIYMAGFVNNDMLITMLTVMSLYYIIKWNENSNIFNTMKLTIVFALGMMTKTSIMVMILPLAVIVLRKMIIEIKNKDKKIIKSIIIQAIIFVILVGIASVWFPIRQWVKYGFEPFSIQKPYDHFFSGDASFVERWGFFSKDIIKNRLEVEDKNIFACVINSSLYCLYNFESAIAYMLKEITVMFAIISLIITLKVFIEKIIKKEFDVVFTLIITFFSWIIGFILFNISLPYSCTMNSRYIAILFLISNIILGYSVSERKNKLWKYTILTLAIILTILSIIILFSKPI